MNIVVATHNEGKLVEIRDILAEEFGDGAHDIELVSAGSLGLPDPVETGITFEANALLKARFVARLTGLPAIADDSGLIVDVMGNAPGILSARWAGEHGNDAANIDLLLAQIEDIPDDDRTARFRCAAALVVPIAAEEDVADFEADPSDGMDDGDGLVDAVKPWCSARCPARLCATRTAATDSATTRSSCPTSSLPEPRKAANCSPPPR